MVVPGLNIHFFNLDERVQHYLTSKVITRKRAGVVSSRFTEISYLAATIGAYQGQNFNKGPFYAQNNRSTHEPRANGTRRSDVRAG
jgi:hypothetical protein